jgi:ribosomal protein L11 methyltransferase
MPLLEIELRLAGDELEAWGDALLARGALSVSACDALADTGAEAPMYGEPGSGPPPAAWDSNVVTVLAPEGFETGRVLSEVAQHLGRRTPQVLRAAAVPDEDWVSRTQAQFGPVEVGRLAIVPSWHEPPAGRAVVRLDPGVAFGTGTHPTTRLCLAWLERELGAGSSVLDYGCGSGILSIAACVLGAGEVVGIDIDPQAVEAARANARRNAVAARYTGTQGTGQKFDIVIANILANPLIVLAPTLARHVAPGGRIVLSGILERQAEAVAQAYAQASPPLALEVWERDDGWVALAGRRDG